MATFSLRLGPLSILLLLANLLTAQTPTPRTVKVMVLNFDPFVQQAGQPVRLHQAYGWNDPRTLANGYIADLQQATNGYLTYSIVNWQDINAFPTKTDGYAYTEATYATCWQNRTSCHTPDGADYPKILRDYGANTAINAGQIDEVWLFGAPYMGFWESAMAGPRAFTINGGTYPEVPTNKTFAVMGFSYERGVAEMLHNLCHRFEATMTFLYGGWQVDQLVNPWARFAANAHQSNGEAAVGTCHFSPNGQSDYDYANPRVVQSSAEDWLNYPNLTGQKRPISSTAWGGPDFQRNYLNWWFNHIPRKNGRDTDNHFLNWWLYVLDFSQNLLNQTPTTSTSYCAAKGIAPWEIWNAQFSIANPFFSKVSGKEGYGNFTALTGATLARGQTNLINISPEASWAGDPRNAALFWRVWIDLNADGDFTDAGEQVINQNVVFTNNSFLVNQSTFAMPTTATLGLTRLRMALKHGSPPEPCETFDRGEVEDYTVQITEGVQSTLPDLTLANLNLTNPSVPQGQILNWKVDIKNIGTAAATGNFNVKAYISTDNVLSTNDIQDGTIPTGSYAAGLTISQVPGASTVSATLAAGQYYLILKVDADNQITEGSETNNVIASATPFTVTMPTTGGSYCVSKALAPWELWTSNVTFGTINNTSDKFKDFSTLGYSDYTNVTATVSKGQTYPLSITPSLSWIGNLPNVYCRVWIDFNNNKTFEANELMLEARGINPLISNVLIPITAVTGNVRMRVAMKWGAYATPCETFDKGEVEDYTLNIGPNVSCIPTITCPRDTTVVIATGGIQYCGGLTLPIFDLTSCNLTVNSLGIAPACLPLGTTLATYHAEFLNGTSANCTFNVAIVQQTTGGADIAVSLVSTPSVFSNFSPLAMAISAKNIGNQAVTNAVVEFKYPTGTVSGGTAVPSVGTWNEWCSGGVQCFEWRIPSLAANATATLNLPLYVLSPTSPIIAVAKLLSSTPVDGNAANNTATLTINKAASPTQPLIAQRPTQLVPIVFQKIAPNPVADEMLLQLESLDAREVAFQFSDAVGKTVRIENRNVEKGMNRVVFDVSNLPQGLYLIQTNVGKGRGVPTKFIKM